MKYSNFFLDYLTGDLIVEPRQTDVHKYFESDDFVTLFDLKDLKGQEIVKRAMEVSAIGGIIC